MKAYGIGCFVMSAAGHDRGKYYVIFHTDGEYVYLVDGKNRTIARPKKKKTKHINGLYQNPRGPDDPSSGFCLYDSALAARISDGTVKDEEIKRAIKLLPDVNSSKEVR